MRNRNGPNFYIADKGDKTTNILKKKPKVKNWLMLFFVWIPVVLIFIWGAYHQFYKSYPEIPKTLSEYSIPLDSPTVSVQFGSPEGIIVKNADVVQPKTLFSIITGEEQNNSIDENKKKELETEINNLKLRKMDLENNISKLKKDYDKLSKISYDIQEAIIKFVEKNRVRDMLASAFVGALISILFTFILSRPAISNVIDNWLWENIQKEKDKSQ